MMVLFYIIWLEQSGQLLKVILKQIEQGNIFADHRKVAGYHFGHDSWLSTLDLYARSHVAISILIEIGTVYK